MESLGLGPRYFPVEKGIFEVAPGLKPLGADCGNEEYDGRVFQIDQDFPRYRANILECRGERLGKYFCAHDFGADVERTLNSFLVGRLAQEYPAYFSYREANAERRLACGLTGDTLRFSDAWDFAGADSSVSPPYVSGFDALASQVPEDLCVMRQGPAPETSPAGAPPRNWLAAVHLCCAGHWAAEDKVGRDFTAIHKPVPGIEKINAAARAFSEAMIRKGPFVRFAWGFATDTRLNHHPVPPPGVDTDTWRGRKFVSPDESRFYLRVERQTTWGFPQVDASLFTIRVSYVDGETLIAEERGLLYSALRSMTPEARAYKGLATSMEPLLAWLARGPTESFR